MGSHTKWTPVLIAVFFCAVVASAEVTAPEYRVKAAFLFKFATYVRWPVADADANAPFVIGVLGTDPFGQALHEVVRGQNVQGRVIVIRTLHRSEDARICAAVFISSSERPRLSAILDALRGTAVLTVSDMDRFAELGGMIGLITTADRHIHFAINTGAMDRAGLTARSQLLRLARIVDETDTDGGLR